MQAKPKMNSPIVVLPSMSKHKIPEGEDGQNPFAEILQVMDIEQLIRFRQRLQKVGRKRMVEILTDEIEEREGIEKAEDFGGELSRTAEKQHAEGARPPKK
jgi:hypothetical protein